jgi:signal transduction histidine kinase
MARKYGGTGLGLTICTRLVEMMDGRIWLERQKEVLDRICALLQSKPEPRLETPVNRTKPEFRRSGRVLLAEDNHVN